MILSADSITCGYGGRPVVRDLTLQVERGVFLVIVGPNGGGKSTLLKSLCRTLKPQCGTVRLEGQDIYRMESRAVARAMAVVAQETAVAFDFTVQEVVMLGRIPHQVPLRGETEKDRAAVRRAMELTNTRHLDGRLVTQLSGGERQRVMVARALAQEPDLLLLDEPTAHLDIAHQVEVLDLIRRLNRSEGLSVVAVLHDLNLAAQYAHRMVMLKEGRIWAEGAPGDVLTEANLLAVYGSRVKVIRHPVEGTPHIILLSKAGPVEVREAVASVGEGGHMGWDD